MKALNTTLALVASLLTAFPAVAQIQAYPIPEIQGDGLDSPLEGQLVITEGAITGIFPSMSAILIQDTLGDGDPATSDGMYVYYPSMPALSVGEYIVVEGEVQEYFGLTEIGNVTDLSVIANGVFVEPTEVILPKPWGFTLEEYESMLVTFPQTMYVTDNYNLARYGEVSVSAEFQLPQPTNVVDPNDTDTTGTTYTGGDNIAEVVQLGLENERRTIVIDDAVGGSWPDPVPFVNPADSTLRTGTTLDGLTGNLIYSFSRFRLVTNDSIPWNYAPRPPKPEFPGANVVVAGYNVLNFWTTLDDGSNDARGADNQSEYNRQRDKLATAITAMDADVVGIMELENNGTAAIDSLVAALNAASAPNQYAGMVGDFSGTDAIQCGIVYQPSRLTPIGAPLVNTDTIFLPPTMAQGFELNSNGEKFVVVVNHFQYKGGCDDATGLDADQGDGQACWNERRKQQAMALLAWLDDVKTHYGDDDLVIVGDFNAYAEEDPIDILVGSELTRVTNGAHTFAFQGQYGALDHAFVNPAALPQVVGAAVWHLNSDEPRYLDYNTEDLSFDFFNANNPYRASDHDPVLVGLLLDSTQVGAAELPVQAHSMAVFPNPFSDDLTIRFDAPRTDRYQVTVYDLRGRSVVSIANTIMERGTNTLRWTGHDASGVPAPAGVYFIEIAAGDQLIGIRKAVRY